MDIQHSARTTPRGRAKIVGHVAATKQAPGTLDKAVADGFCLYNINQFDFSAKTLRNLASHRRARARELSLERQAQDLLVVLECVLAMRPAKPRCR